MAFPSTESSRGDRRQIERVALGDHVYERVVEWIMDGTLPPGANLRLQFLVEELGVSQTPIREALSRLEGEGMVDRTPMRGYTVAAPLDAADQEKLNQVRMLLEPQIAFSAAQFASGDEAAALVSNVAESKAISVGSSYSEYRGYLELSAQFHDLLARAGHDRFLVRAVEALPIHVQRFRLFGDTGIDDVDVSLAEHASIADAVLRGDADAAAGAMRTHIEGVARRSSNRRGRE